MAQDKVLYTDGHDVTVTNSVLEVKKHKYVLDGITKFGMMKLQPMRAPGIILLIVGVLLLISGFFNLLSPYLIQDVQLGERMINANALALWIGGTLAFIGILVIGLSRERYAVRIATAEGEKDALISFKREYILQIIDALNEAFGNDKDKRASGYFTVDRV